MVWLQPCTCRKSQQNQYTFLSSEQHPIFLLVLIMIEVFFSRHFRKFITSQPPIHPKIITPNGYMLRKRSVSHCWNSYYNNNNNKTKEKTKTNLALVSSTAEEMSPIEVKYELLQIKKNVYNWRWRTGSGRIKMSSILIGCPIHAALCYI